jgi:glycosyltransferase involved in cell wall biosynthesis
MKKIFLSFALCVAFVMAIVISSSLNQEGYFGSFSAKPREKSICLNMIVKNENSVIKNCLSSVKGMIDYWVIVDTGSTDGTQETIREFMKDVPGELYERPWVNFEHNRNEALALAKNKASYTLFMDADEVLIFSNEFARPELDKDLYSIKLEQKEGANSIKWFMVNNKLDWKWQGVIHETITCSEVKSQELIKGVVNYSDTSLGARSKDPRKYLRDALVLEEELEKDPTNTRYQFYLAVAYLNANELHSALKNFEKRAKMGGEEGEVFISLLLKARLQEHFQVPSDVVIENYQKAHNHTPSRAESLFYLGSYYLDSKEYELAYETLKMAPTSFEPEEIFFTDAQIYDWKLQYFIARACLHLEKYEEMKIALEKVTLGKNVPKNVLDESFNNLAILGGKLRKMP